LALNMMTDARAGFTAFNSGDRKIGRTINFAKLRLLIAEGKVYDDNMINRILPEGVKLPG
ncbi:MAG: 6-oxocyclohex-1-ene-1-carbonyl-CoA hydratase, partial [Nanoarchaeota archaeon]|nr:6-oxocyclohex-1-ene-1-carbonyl-CoA hydratase [Nanoarchaeota archaeon]